MIVHKKNPFRRVQTEKQFRRVLAKLAADNIFEFDLFELPYGPNYNKQIRLLMNYDAKCYYDDKKGTVSKSEVYRRFNMWAAGGECPYSPCGSPSWEKRPNEVYPVYRAVAFEEDYRIWRRSKREVDWIEIFDLLYAFAEWKTTEWDDGMFGCVGYW